jgi:uncharacterized cofD-like protein
MTTIDLLAEPLLEEIEPGEPGTAVVALGGGHGLAQALLAAQHYAGSITAVVSVADDGGSSGRLAPALGIPPPGDCRRALLSLSPDPSPWRDVIGHRFDAGDVAGHSLGNLVLAALAQGTGGLEEALATVGRLIGARGRVVPVCPQPLALRARVDGVQVTGQVAIARSRGGIEGLEVLPPEAAASPSALEAIRRADQVVIGPGSLFTSLCAVLLVPGVASAVNGSDARLVYVCNLTTQDGETLGLDGAAHLRSLVETTGVRPPDVVVANDAPFLVPEAVQPLWAEGAAVAALGSRLETGPLADPEADWPQHHPARLGAVLRRLA